MERVIDFTLVLRCTDRQLKLCRREVQRLAADAGIPVIWKDLTVDGELAMIVGSLPLDYQGQFLEIVMERYKRRYVRTELSRTSSSTKSNKVGLSQGTPVPVVVTNENTEPETTLTPTPLEVQISDNVVPLDDTNQVVVQPDVGSFTPVSRVRTRRSIGRRRSGVRSVGRRVRNETSS